MQSSPTHSWVSQPLRSNEATWTRPWPVPTECWRARSVREVRSISILNRWRQSPCQEMKTMRLRSGLGLKISCFNRYVLLTSKHCKIKGIIQSNFVIHLSAYPPCHHIWNYSRLEYFHQFFVSVSVPPPPLIWCSVFLYLPSPYAVTQHLMICVVLDKCKQTYRVSHNKWCHYKM